MMQINAIMKQNGVGLSQTIVVQLAKMNPAEQNGWMKKLIQTGLEQRRLKLAAAAAAGGASSGLGGTNSSVTAGMSVPQMGMMPQMGRQQQHQQPQQHQRDMGGFNPAQFALGGATGMGGRVAGRIGAMGGRIDARSSGMYPDVMAGAGLPRTASNGGGINGVTVSDEMM
jgi:hypothetical protein